MSYAEVKKVNGSPALVIDGKTHPPMAMTVRFNKPDYIHDLGQSGMKVFFLMTNTEAPAGKRLCGRKRGKTARAQRNGSVHS